MFTQKRNIIALACAGMAGLSSELKPAYAQTASWLSSVDGDFSDGSKWSSNPDYPNGAGSIAVLGPNATGYTVTLDSSVTLAQLNINTSAELNLTGTLNTPLVIISNGSLLLAGGTISNATVTTIGPGQLAVINSTGSTLDGVKLNTNLDLQSSFITLYDGLTLNNNHKLLVDSAIAASQVQMMGAQTIGGIGTVEFDGSIGHAAIQSYADAGGAGTITVGSGVTMQTGTSSGTINGDALVNNGTLLAQSTALTLSIATNYFTNNGTIRATNGVVDIGGTIPVGGLGNFDASAGTVQLRGTLLNSGSTLNLSGAAQILTLNGGTISGGTIATSGGQLALGSAGGNLDGVTLDTDLAIHSATLGIYHGLTLNNRTLSLDSQTVGSQIQLFGPQTIGGTGTIEFDGTDADATIGAFAGSDGDGTITVGSGVTIQTGTVRGQFTGHALVNNGTLLSQTAGSPLFIATSNFTNNGLIRAKSGGVVGISGTIPVGGLGNFDATGGTVALLGTLLNSGSTLNLAGTAHILALYGGTISGGTITTSGGGKLTFSSELQGTLDGVTLDTDLTVPSATLVLYNGLTLHNRTLSVDSQTAGSQIQLLGDQTIGGTGTVEFDGTDPNATIAGYSDGTTVGTITVGSGITLQTGSTVRGTITGNGIINNGTLLAQNSQTLEVDTNLTNNGMIRATSGGVVSIGGTIPVGGLGAFDATGGTVQLHGTLLNSGSTLNLSGPAQILTLANGVISGGTITTSGGGQLIVNNDGILDGVTLDTDLAIHSTLVTVRDGLTLNNRTLSFDSQASIGAATVYVIGSQTIGGTGTIEFDGTDTNGTIGGFSDGTTLGTITVGSGITIQTGTVRGTIEGNGIVNNGTLLAQNSQTLQVTAPLTNNGMLSATTNGRLIVTAPFDLSAPGVISTATGGVVEINGTVHAPADTTSSINVSAGTSTISGQLTVDSNAVLQKLGDGTLILAGPQSWAPGTTLEMDGGVADIQSDPGGNVFIHGNATIVHFQGGFGSPLLKAAGMQWNTPGTGILDPGGQTTVETQKLSIDVNDGGKMDINDNKLVVDYDPAGGNADPIDTIYGYIQHAYHGGAWDGTGLGSTTAMMIDANSMVLNKTGVGYAEASAIFPGSGNAFGAATVDNTAILMSYALYGDANLDGTVNALDFNALATRYGKSGYWYQGDFDYSGSITSSDFDMLASNFGDSLAPDVNSGGGPGGGGPGGSLVPEPMGMGSVLIGGLVLSRKRRKI